MCLWSVSVPYDKDVAKVLELWYKGFPMNDRSKLKAMSLAIKMGVLGKDWQPAKIARFSYLSACGGRPPPNGMDLKPEIEKRQRTADYGPELSKLEEYLGESVESFMENLLLNT